VVKRTSVATSASRWRQRTTVEWSPIVSDPSQGNAESEALVAVYVNSAGWV